MLYVVVVVAVMLAGIVLFMFHVCVNVLLHQTYRTQARDAIGGVELGDVTGVKGNSWRLRDGK